MKEKTKAFITKQAILNKRVWNLRGQPYHLGSSSTTLSLEAFPITSSSLSFTAVSGRQAFSRVASKVDGHQNPSLQRFPYKGNQALVFLLPQPTWIRPHLQAPPPEGHSTHPEGRQPRCGDNTIKSPWKRSCSYCFQQQHYPLRGAQPPSSKGKTTVHTLNKLKILQVLTL